MTKRTALDESLGGITGRISDAQPGALADAMAALERERKALSPLTGAIAELGAAAGSGEVLSNLTRLGDPLSDVTGTLGIEQSAIDGARGAVTTEMDDVMRGALSTNDLAAITGMDQTLADAVKGAIDPLGVDSSVLSGELSLAKAAAGALGEIDSLRGAIGAATGSLGVPDEHKRMSDLLGASQPYDRAALAGPVSRAIAAPGARNERASAQRAAAARRKITSARDIGELVREARRKMKLNQQEFADLAGVGRRFVSELESGKPTLEFDKVMQACAAAGIDVTAARRGSS